MLRSDADVDLRARRHEILDHSSGPNRAIGPLCVSVRFFVAATGHSFGAIFTLNDSNDVFSQPLVPFGGYINIAHY